MVNRLTDKLKEAIAGDPNSQQQAANPKTAVVPQQQGGVPMDPSAFDNLPSGYDNVTANDLIIPRLVILQALSPQLDKTKPEYNKDASAGDFCDVATGDIWKDKITVIPVYFATVALEWAPRASGKGLIANHGLWNDDKVLKLAKQNEKRQWFTKEGNLIAQTATFFVLNMSADGQRSFIPMSSTQLKNARNWMTVITRENRPTSSGELVQAPLYWRSWEARAVPQSNTQGSWYGWKFDPGKTLWELGGKKLLEEAVDFNAQAKSGLVQGDFGNEVVEEENSGKM